MSFDVSPCDFIDNVLSHRSLHCESYAEDQWTPKVPVLQFASLGSVPDRHDDVPCSDADLLEVSPLDHSDTTIDSQTDSSRVFENLCLAIV